jgi:hypothetical protein
MFAAGATSKNYVTLLEEAGLKPSRLDKFLDGIQKGLLLLIGGGLILILVSFVLRFFDS